MKNKYLVLGLILVFGLIGTNSFSASEWDKTRPVLTNQKIDWPTASQANNEALDRVLANYREGVTISYLSTSTVSVSAGEVVCMNSSSSLKKMRQNTSATTVTWADIDTGSEANSTTYYVYAVADADAATFTLSVSLSDSAPSGATYYKKLGSFYNNSAGNIINVLNDSTFAYLGASASKTVETTYQALTDGIVTAYLVDSGVAQQNLGAYITGYVGETSTPATQMQRCYIENCDNCGTAVRIFTCSISFPVRIGNYYKVTDTNNTGTSTTIYFTPTGR